MITLQSLDINLRGHEPLPLMTQVQQAYVERFGHSPESRGGVYDADNWSRVSQVFQRLDKGGDSLDIGPGAGQFVNCLALSGQFRSVTALDKFWHRKYIEITDGITRVDGNVAAIDFPDDSFDVVTCQEVLEHLPEKIFTRAIEELRRVCRGQLIITVPYREPEPIPKYHLRRFEDEDLTRLFPHADFAVLRRPRRAWILIEERPNEPVRRIAVTGGVPDPRVLLEGQVAQLQREVDALRGRKSLRAVNWAGSRARRVKRRIRKLTAGS